MEKSEKVTVSFTCETWQAVLLITAHAILEGIEDVSVGNNAAWLFEELVDNLPNVDYDETSSELWHVIVAFIDRRMVRIAEMARRVEAQMAEEKHACPGV